LIPVWVPSRKDGARFVHFVRSRGLELLKVLFRSRSAVINRRNGCGTTFTLKTVVSGKFQNPSIFLVIFAYNY